MKWINNFDLFLFDFDGLLVNTEVLHFFAYINMLKKRGFDLGWSFDTYCSIAHLSNEGLKNEIYSKFPKLYEMQSSWEVLYNEKKNEYLDLLKKSRVELMPGVSKVLLTLKKSNKKSCVVTNSLLSQVQVIIENNPILKNIDHWITREDYKNPKPHPECYQKAIELYGKKEGRIVGFEDSIRGMLALTKTKATCVLISSSRHSKEEELLEKKVLHFDSFESIPESFSKE
jgi:beta-phosphoglucomutase